MLLVIYQSLHLLKWKINTFMQLHVTYHNSQQGKYMYMTCTCSCNNVHVHMFFWIMAQFQVSAATILQAQILKWWKQCNLPVKRTPHSLLHVDVVAENARTHFWKPHTCTLLIFSFIIHVPSQHTDVLKSYME